jgi:hypothetical protein
LSKRSRQSRSGRYSTRNSPPASTSPSPFLIGRAGVRRGGRTPITAPPAPAAPVASPARTARPAAARERAEWVWRPANGSLRVRVIIALVVMFYGAQLLLDIHDRQNEALQPILQHQLERLRDDRLRMGSPAPQSPASPTGTTGQPPATP